MQNSNVRFAALALAALVASAPSFGVAARTPQQQQQRPTAQPPSPQPADEKKQQRPRTAPPTAAQSVGERMEPDDRSAPPRADVPAEVLAGRREGLSEEEAGVTPYFNNFMSTYRLGPEDVISITVFGPYQDRYSKANIVIPPHAEITHPLVPDGIFVGGKTTKQVQDELTKLFDEYIENPKVTVTIDKAQSAVFWVAGDVAQPGIRPMTRRFSVTEALMLAGGVLDTGNKKKVTVVRRGPDGFLQQFPVDVAAIEKGKQPDNFFLSPGDQVIVPGNRLKTVNKVLALLPVVSFFRIFTGGGW
jgi:protein involved in polysaccharide export with SLBB domain